MFTFYQPDLDRAAPALPPDESKHCARVLRQQPGDAIRVVDGRGNYYEGVLQRVDARRCAFEVIKTWPEARLNYAIHLAIAPTKSLDRTEWMIEKAVEIGVDQVSFVCCAHSERRVLKLDRLTKKAVNAMKQSGRASLPHLRALQTFQQFLSVSNGASQRFIAYVDPNNTVLLEQAALPSLHYEVLVGPEGGFSPLEVSDAQAAGFQAVSLGPYRLRTETAGLSVCSALNLIQRLSTSGQ